MKTQFEIALEEAGVFAPSAEEVLMDKQEVAINGDDTLEGWLSAGLHRLNTKEANDFLDGCEDRPDVVAQLFATQSRSYN